MLLSEWLSTHEIRRHDLAELLGVHPVTVTKWTTGRMRPRYPMMQRITDITEGSVQASDWFPPRPETARQASGAPTPEAPQERTAA